MTSTLNPAPAALPARIRKAMQDGRLPQALDLAKQLFAQAPTDANREELQSVLLEGIRYQIRRDAAADARRLLDDAERFASPDPAWWEKLAFCRAEIGDGDRARQLLEKAPGTTALPRILGVTVDRAMADRQRGRDLVPTDLRPGFDLIRQAFAQYDQGHDEAARQSLQGIGLQSPFLDWKLLLRGLLAYTANDDVRAQENWSRLDPERLPAKLALPFRYNLDPAFRARVPANQAKAIAQRATILAHPILGQLRDLQLLLGSPEELPKALRKASALLGAMKVSFPQLVPKLANCLYWLIVHGGEPEELDHYQRLFGPHPDDKKFNRMKALVMENIGKLEAAHQHWKAYHDEIAADAVHWPGEFGRRARSMIWARMGDNAQQHLEMEEEEDDDFSFLDVLDMLGGRGRKPRPPKRPLNPSPEQCYKQALELTPDSKGPALSLINLLANNERFGQAEDVARALLERCPDDVDALRELTDLQCVQGKMGAAIESLKQAIKSNPLDRELRARLSLMSLERARALVEQGEYSEAEPVIQEAIEHEPGVLAKLARAMSVACAYKQGDVAKAERLLAEFGADPKERAGIAYTILVEATRLKVSKSVLKEHQARFEQVLAEPLGLAELNLLAIMFGFYRQEPKPYRGIGPHEKKIAARLQALVDTQPPEAELADLGFMLGRNRFVKLLQVCAKQGQDRFPDNPCFLFLLGEQAILQKPKTFSVRQVGRLFLRVLEMTEDEHDDRSRRMREVIERRKEEHPRLDRSMRPVFGFGFPRGFPF